MNRNDKEDAVTREILEAIDDDSSFTQRRLAKRLGVALGLTNQYLKRCIRKGFVKVKQAPANRYLYYLTPRGMIEKGRLTAEYLHHSFDFYRRASASFAEVFSECSRRGWTRAILFGASELAELAIVRAHDSNIAIIGIIDERETRGTFLGVPMWKRFDDVPAFDVIVLTALEGAREYYADAAGQVAADRLVVPEILQFAVPVGVADTGHPHSQ